MNDWIRKLFFFRPSFSNEDIDAQQSEYQHNGDAGSYFLDSDSLKQPRPWYDDYHFSSEAGAYYEYVFCGRGLEIIGLSGPDGGEGEVFIDSVSSGTLNCRNPEKAYQQAIFKIDGLEKESHTVKVVVVGTGVVYLDALRIL